MWCKSARSKLIDDWRQTELSQHGRQQPLDNICLLAVCLAFSVVQAAAEDVEEAARKPGSI
jgi:hypothetical protein